MTEVLKWIGYGAAGWFTLSVLVAAGWHLWRSAGGRVDLMQDDYDDLAEVFEFKAGDR